MLNPTVVESITPPPRIHMDISSNLQRYPDIDYVELKQSASEYYNVPTTRLTVGMGIDGLIVFSLLAFGENTILCCPTFEVYEYCLMTFKKKHIKINFGPRYNITADQILNYYSNTTGLIVLCSPNNPTGNIISREEILKILTSVSCNVIIDEAYAELAGVSNLDLVDTYQNLVIFRSLSKAFSVAGIRVGFAIGHERIISTIEALRKKILPFCISIVSEQAAIAVLKHKKYPEKNRQKTQNIRYWFQQQLNEFKNLKIYPSSTNFILVEAVTLEMKEKLDAEGVSNCCAYGLSSSFFRIVIKEKETLRSLLEALR